MLLNVEKLDIIIPIYNEEECINELMKRLLILIDNISYLDINLIFINDGSKDKSLDLLFDYSKRYEFVKVLNFSRNFGHQIAVTAGLDYADADYIAIIDADLQDPPELIEDMYKKAKEGFDVVYGKRLTRKGETFIKRITAKMFYKFLSKMCDVNIPADTGDFRLISKRVLLELKNMKEMHRFLRGLVPWVGFKSVSLSYHRDERFAGETKYPLKKMVKFAKDAVFSFSNVPLRVANYIGTQIVLLGILGGAFMLYIKIFTDYAVPGTTVLILTVIILGGVQIMILGIIGEYIGRIFEESKNRPLYIIAESKNFSSHI